MMRLFFRTSFFFFGGLFLLVTCDRAVKSVGMLSADAPPSLLGTVALLAPIAAWLFGGLLLLYVAKLGGRLSTDEAVLHVLGKLHPITRTFGRLIRFLGVDGVLVVFVLALTGIAVMGDLNGRRIEAVAVLVALVMVSLKALKKLRGKVRPASDARLGNSSLSSKAILLLSLAFFFVLVVIVNSFMDLRWLYWTQYILSLVFILIFGFESRQIRASTADIQPAVDNDVSMADADLLPEMDLVKVVDVLDQAPS